MAVFCDAICLLQDGVSKQVKGLGEYRNGLYYLVNSPLEKVSPNLLDKGQKLLTQLYGKPRLGKSFVGIASKSDNATLWHKRLGHAPFSKLKLIEAILVSVTIRSCV